MSSPSPSQAGRLDRRVLVVSGVVILGSFMSILDSTIVNVALATLSRELGSPLHTIQWVASGYLVALAVVIPLTGWASERFGARQLWLTVVALFIAGSALSGLAWSAESLIAFRVLQGLGGGMIMPAGMTILAQTAGPQRIGRVMSVVGVPMLLAPVLGPVLGGLLLQGLSWHWIFYLNVPVGLVALALGHRILPRSTPRPGDPLDGRGLALLSPGLAAIVFGLSETSSQDGIGYIGAWLPIVVGAGLVAAFAWHALHLRDRAPLLDLRLFRSGGFAAAAVTVMMLSAAVFGGLLLLPLYFQVDRGASTLATGLLLAPQGLGAALAMPFSGRLADRVGGGVVSLAGLVVITAATVPLAFLGAHTPYAVTSAILLVRGIGQGFSVMPAMAAAYQTLSTAAVPRATTTLNALQRVGSSIGTAVLAVVLESQLKAGLPGVAGVADGSLAPLPAAVRTQVATPVAHAFDHTFRWAVAFTALAGLAALVLAAKAPTRAGRARAATPYRERGTSGAPSSPRVPHRSVAPGPTTATARAGTIDPTV
jgi:EmrB/QacA subfamily drug resistance transporter